MIATLEFADLLDHAEDFGKMVIESDIMEAYKKAKQDLDNDQHAQSLIKAFNDIKDQYAEVQRFGRYHPDYNEIMKAVRVKKREMDMNDMVAAFKVAERNMQKLLDDISECIALAISDQIKVPKEGAALAEGCGSGGGCGCKAS